VGWGWSFHSIKYLFYPFGQPRGTNADSLLARCRVSSGYIFYIRWRGEATRGKNDRALMNSMPTIKLGRERYIFTKASFLGQSYVLPAQPDNLHHNNFDTSGMFHPRMFSIAVPKNQFLPHQYNTKLQQIFLLFVSFVTFSFTFYLAYTL